jgi:hypothetical protein
VPGALTVNPAFTIAALAERSVPGIIEAVARRGVPMRYVADPPGAFSSSRRPPAVRV